MHENKKYGERVGISNFKWSMYKLSFTSNASIVLIVNVSVYSSLCGTKTLGMVCHYVGCVKCWTMAQHLTNP